MLGFGAFLGAFVGLSGVYARVWLVGCRSKPQLSPRLCKYTPCTFEVDPLGLGLGIWDKKTIGVTMSRLSQERHQDSVNWV